MTWRFLNTGFSDGLFNMSFDEGLVRSLQEHGQSGTVRVYGWNPYAISVGWNQSFDEIDSAKAAISDIDIVRRPTGGRAILHSEELTYSVVMLTTGRNVLQVYNDISLALVEGIRSLGIDATLARAQPHFPTLYRSGASVACFSSSARYEIQVGGRKLVGSAQRRYAGRDGREMVLQHGSLLMGSDHRRIADFLALPQIITAEEVRRDLMEKTTDLESALGARPAFDAVANTLRGGFERAWGIRFEREPSHHDNEVTA